MIALALWTRAISLAVCLRVALAAMPEDAVDSPPFVHLQLQRLNLMSNRIAFFEADVDLPSITNDAIKYLCFLLEYVNDANIARCTQLVSRTCRARSIQSFLSLYSSSEDASADDPDDPSGYGEDAAHIALLETYAGYRSDAMLFLLTYAYNDRLTDSKASSQPEITVCMVGAINSQAIRLLIAYNPSYRVWVFSEPLSDLEVAMHVRLRRYMRRNNRGLELITDMAFEEFILGLPEGDRQFCDIIHNRVPGMESEEAIHRRAALALRPNRYNLPAQVLWESYYVTGVNREDTVRTYLPENSFRNEVMHSQEFNGFERSIQWESSAKWTSISKMDLTEPDYNGFAHWQHFFGTKDHNFVLYSGVKKAEQLDRTEVADVNTACSAGAVLETVIFITYTARVFEETAFGLHTALLSEGFKYAAVMGDYNITRYRELILFAEQLSEACRDDVLVLQITVGVHELEVLSPYYIALQMEQPWNYFFTMKSASALYLDALRDAISVWTMSDQHSDFLVNRFGMSRDRLHVVPLYNEPAPLPEGKPLDQLLSGLRSTGLWNGPEQEDVDVTFFGFCSQRRTDLLLELIPLLQQDGIRFRVLCSQVSTARWGHEREMMIAQSKVLLNLHMWGNSSLEIHRVNNLLSRRKCVVSERSSQDPLLDKAYEDTGAVVFGQGTVELAALLKSVVLDSGLRRSVESKGYDRYLQLVKSNTTPLREAVFRAVDIVRATRTAT